MKTTTYDSMDNKLLQAIQAHCQRPRRYVFFAAFETEDYGDRNDHDGERLTPWVISDILDKVAYQGLVEVGEAAMVNPTWLDLCIATNETLDRPMLLIGVGDDGSPILVEDNPTWLDLRIATNETLDRPMPPIGVGDDGSPIPVEDVDT